MIPWLLSVAKLRRIFASNDADEQTVLKIHPDDGYAKPIKQVGDYNVLHTIGKGSTGKVKLGVHKNSGQHVAIKAISRRHLLSSATASHAVEKELAILHLVQHPNIIDLLYVFQDQMNIYFVTEYVQGGDLYQVLTVQHRFLEQDAKHMFGQLADALAWCHAHHICHRDLKLENILYDAKMKTLKIADFGMATIQPADTLLTTSCGSPNYASPEIVASKPYYGPAADVWSAGVILFTMLAGYFPFDDSHLPSLLSKIKRGRRRRIPGYTSRMAKDLILRMLMPDPARRISMMQVLEHPWINGSSHKTSNHIEIATAGTVATLSEVDNTQRGRIIENIREMDGRIWETLKVLWRDCDQETLLNMLTAEGSTVQKAAFRLLSERFKKRSVK